MTPAERADYRCRAAVRTIKVVVATIGIGLQCAMPPSEMRVGMDFLAIGREVKERRGRGTADEGAVIAHISS